MNAPNLEQLYKQNYDTSHAAALQAVFNAGVASVELAADAADVATSGDSSTDDATAQKAE